MLVLISPRASPEIPWSAQPPRTCRSCFWQCFEQSKTARHAKHQGEHTDSRQNVVATHPASGVGAATAMAMAMATAGGCTRSLSQFN